jgi:hypothetical protein
MKLFKWHYGILRKTVRVKNKTQHYYQIHEIYDDKGKLSWTKDPITPTGEDIKDIRMVLAMMLTDTIRMPIYEERKGKLIERKMR